MIAGGLWKTLSSARRRPHCRCGSLRTMEDHFLLHLTTHPDRLRAPPRRTLPLPVNSLNKESSNRRNLVSPMCTLQLLLLAGDLLPALQRRPRRPRLAPTQPSSQPRARLLQSHHLSTTAITQRHRSRKDPRRRSAIWPQRSATRGRLSEPCQGSWPSVSTQRCKS